MNTNIQLIKTEARVVFNSYLTETKVYDELVKNLIDDGLLKTDDLTNIVEVIKSKEPCLFYNPNGMDEHRLILEIKIQR